MSGEPNLPLSQLVRWGALAVLILIAVVLYFRHGLDLPSLGAERRAADSAAAAP
jgi:hypothetical protein